MERVSTSTNTGTDPTIAGYAAGPQPAGWFSDGTPGVIDGTIPGAQWMNQVQEEIVNAIVHDTAVVAAADVLLEDQLATAIGSLKALRSSATDTTSITPTHLRANLAASASQATGAASLVAASDTGSVASGAASAVLASTAATASGARSAAVASNGVAIGGAESAALASKGLIVAGATNAALIACGGNVSSGDATSNNTAVIASIETAATTAATGEQSAVIACDDVLASGTRSVGMASDGATVSGIRCAAIASDGCTVSSTTDGAAIASGNSTVSGTEAAVIACNTAIASGAGSVMIGSLDGEASGTESGVMCSASKVYATGTRSVLVASDNAQLHTGSAIAGGDTGAGAITKGVANQELTWRIESPSGDIYSDGVVGAGAADYAEMKENATAGEIPVGLMVTTKRGQVLPASKADDRVVGVVSSTPAIIGNDPMGWRARHELDEWGRPVLVDVEWVEWPQLTSTDLGPRDKAQAKLDAAGQAFTDAVAARNTAHLQEQDKREWLLAPSNAFRAATEQLRPWVPGRRSWAKAPRNATNEHIWKAIEAAQAKMATADADMRAHVAARVQAADEAVTKTQAKMDAARAAMMAIKPVVTVTREGYRGPLADCPMTPPDDARLWTRESRVRPAQYDPTREYVMRRDRKEEWTCIGMLGQIRTRIDATVSEDCWVVPGPGGIATASKKPGVGRPVYCEQILSPFDPARGYGIGMALVG